MDATRCVALLLVCHGFDPKGASRGRQGRDGKALCKGKAEHRKVEHREKERAEQWVLENCYYVFLCFMFFFFNNVLMWKFVGVLEVLVYIYIDE